MSPYPWQEIRDPLAISSGELRHEVHIQSQTSTQDDYGGLLLSWNTILTCFAAIYGASSKEVFQASKFTAEVSHVVKIRYPGAIGIQGGQQVLFGSRVFRLQFVDNVQERNRVLLLHCLEINGVV